MPKHAHISAHAFPSSCGKTTDFNVLKGMTLVAVRNYNAMFGRVTEKEEICPLELAQDVIYSFECSLFCEREKLLLVGTMPFTGKIIFRQKEERCQEETFTMGFIHCLCL